MSDEAFSVCQFFENDSYEYVRRHVPLQESMLAAHHYCNSVAAKLGMTRRVIITDPLDCVVFEWKYGEGIVWPEEMKGKQA